MRFVLTAAVASLLTLSVPRAASAQTVWYKGPHPISKRLLKGMCYIPGPHVHSYTPPKPLLFVKTGRHQVFVGDPVEYELEAPRHAYYGHHPLFWIPPGHRGKHYCYITGPHHHWYKPKGRAKFKRKGKVYWYVGGHPGWYNPKHPRATMLRAHYHSIGVPLFEVKVSPPVGFVGAVVGASWLTGHLLLRWHGGHWYGRGPKFHRWHGHKWKRPKWRRGHWRHAHWKSRWKHRRRWKGKRYKHGRRHGSRRVGRRAGASSRRKGK